MSENLFKGKWHEYKGSLKEKWAELTDDDLTEIDGKKEVLFGKLQSLGYPRDRIEKELAHFEKTCHSENSEF